MFLTDFTYGHHFGVPHDAPGNLDSVVFVDVGMIGVATNCPVDALSRQQLLHVRFPIWVRMQTGEVHEDCDTSFEFVVIFSMYLFEFFKWKVMPPHLAKQSLVQVAMGVEDVSLWGRVWINLEVVRAVPARGLPEYVPENAAGNELRLGKLQLQGGVES